MALAQQDLKRLLAYSSINQIGYILIRSVWGTADGASGALFHTINHAFAKSCLFLCAGVMIEKPDAEKSRVSHCCQRDAGETIIFILASLAHRHSLAGGFFSKLMIGLASVENGHPFVALVIFFSSIITAYFLRCIGVFFQGGAG